MLKNKRVLGDMKNKIVASELVDERANCNFDQSEMKKILMPDEVSNQIRDQVAKDIQSDPEIAWSVSEKYYEMSREEIQHMWMKKLNHLWNFNKNFYFKKGLTSSYNWYWAHLGQPPFGLHVTMFKDSIETFCDDE